MQCSIIAHRAPIHAPGTAARLPPFAALHSTKVCSGSSRCSVSVAHAGGNAAGKGESQPFISGQAAESLRALTPPWVRQQQAFVRSVAADDKLTVTLLVGGKQRNLTRCAASPVPPGRLLMLAAACWKWVVPHCPIYSPFLPCPLPAWLAGRPKDEPLEKPLARLKASVQPQPAKGFGKKGKKGQQEAAAAAPEGAPGAAAGAAEEPADVFVGLFRDVAGTQPLDGALPNGTAWREARLLLVGSQAYDVEYNPPTVDRLALLKRPLVGCRLLPTCSLLFADADACSWKWQRRAPGSASWQDVPDACHPHYTPGQQDAGCMLRVTCMPGARRSATGVITHGEPASVETGPVAPTPAATSATIRCAQAPPPPAAPQRLRIMSYNILADQYAGSDYAQKVLFSYCPGPALDPEYRKQLVLQELLGYQVRGCGPAACGRLWRA